MKKLLFLLLLSSSCHAAFTEFYVDIVGGSTNSGHTTSSTPIVAAQNGNWDSVTGIYICAGATDLSGVSVGDWASVYNDGATAAVFVGRITAVDDGTDTITVSVIYKMGTPPTTSATARSITIGGCWVFPNGTATDVPFSLFSNAAFNSASNPPSLNIKSNGYSITGQIDFTGSGNIEGYLTTPHDGGRPVVSTPTGASFVMVNAAGGNLSQMKNIEWDANFTSGTSVGINTGARDVYIGVIVRDSRGNAFQVSNEGVVFIGCEAIGSVTGAGFAATAECLFYQCVSHKNALHGFSLGGAVIHAFNSIAYSNSVHGFNLSGTATIQSVVNCDAYGNYTNGFAIVADNPYAFINCNALGNGQYGIAHSSATTVQLVNLFNCGFGSGSQTNASGNILNVVGNIIEIGTITYPADSTPWLNPSVGNFSINSPYSKNAGFNTFLQKEVLSENKTVGHFDVGAAPASSAGSGGSFTFSQ